MRFSVTSPAQNALLRESDTPRVRLYVSRRLRRGALVYTVTPLRTAVGMQKCTQIGENGLSTPVWGTCVHYCVPTVARTILARLNSVHKCPNPERRGPILPFVYTIVIPRPPTTQAHGATVYTNAPIRRGEAILANLCTLLRRRQCGEAHVAGAVTQPPTHTNSRSLYY